MEEEADETNVGGHVLLSANINNSRDENERINIEKAR